MNSFNRLLKLIPGQPIDTGQVVAVDVDGVTVQLLTGEQIRVRGTATIGEHVYIRAGAVDGPAPDLPGQDVEV